MEGSPGIDQSKLAKQPFLSFLRLKFKGVKLEETEPVTRISLFSISFRLVGFEKR